MVKRTGRTLAEEVSEFVVNLRYEELPSSVVESAKRHLLDIVGVGIRGADEDACERIVSALVRMSQGLGTSCVWGQGPRLSVGYAALANSVAAHCLDFDDTHTQSITHGSAVLGPLVLSVAEDVNASGREAVTAFVAGWEVTARVGLAAQGTFHKRGFHTTSIAGIFGAVVAAAKLLKLNVLEVRQALGIAGSQASGVSEYLSDGSDTKSFHTGWAAYSGLVATNLAHAGATGPATIFEGRYGLFTTYGIREACSPERVSSNLGSQWEIERVSIKPYPCCHFAHAFIDCAKELHARGVHPDNVAYIECIVPDIEVPLICEPWDSKLRPSSVYAARFSLPFLVSAGFVDGDVANETFDIKTIRRADLADVTKKISYRIPSAEETSFPRYFPGWIRATLRDGNRIDARVDVNYGHPDKPMTHDDVTDKFLDNASCFIDGNKADRFIDLMLTLERMKHISMSALLGMQCSKQSASGEEI